MTYKQAVEDFKETYSDLYERQVDYWTAQLAWSNYVDNLRKDGFITEKQWNNWGTPFAYGKRLSVRKVYSR